MPSLVIVSPLTARVPAVVIFPEASTWNALAVPEVNVPLASRFPVISVLPLMLVTPSMIYISSSIFHQELMCYF